MKTKKNIEEIQKKIVEFKNQYIKEDISIDYEKFAKYFFVENYFYNNKTPYIKGKFYETLFEIIGNLFKNYLQEFEYYSNVKPMNKITNIDYEILNMNTKKTDKLYLNLHLNYKKFHLIALNFQTNEKEVAEFLENIFDLFLKINVNVKKIQKDMIKNLEKEIKQLNKKEKSKPQFESSIFH